MKNLSFTLLLALGVSTALQAQESVFDVIAGSENHTRLEAAIIAAGLQETLSGEGTFTVFAPNDAAFAAFEEQNPGATDMLLAAPDQLAPVLLYHVLGATVMSTDLGELQFPNSLSTAAYDATLGLSIQVTSSEDNGVMLNGNATVEAADLMASNGVVHSIDSLIFAQSVTGIAVNSPVHTTLESVVVDADLAGTLDTTSPITVFAPVDDAFAAIPDSVLSSITSDPTGLLTTVLTYHVVPSILPSSAATTDTAMVATLQSENVSVVGDGMGGVTVNGIAVAVPDIIATNGIVHAIAGVLIPEALSSSANEVLASSVGIQVGPVPARGFTNVTIPSHLTARFDLSVLNANGTAVVRQRATAGTTRVDLSGVSAGSYFLLLEAGDEAYYQPFVVR